MKPKPSKRKAKRPKKKGSRTYEPLVKTDLTFDQMLKLAARTPPQEKSKKR